MLSIHPVVTASLVSHSAEAAQYPNWLWVKDSVQSANAATDCWSNQPILWQLVKYSIRASGSRPEASPCHPPMFYSALWAFVSCDLSILLACVGSHSQKTVVVNMLESKITIINFSHLLDLQESSQSLQWSSTTTRYLWNQLVVVQKPTKCSCAP